MSLVGLAIVMAMRIEARIHLRPERVLLGGRELLLRREAGTGAILVHTLPDGRPLARVASALATCDPPEIILFDLDGDGRDDLYYGDCRRDGMLLYDRAGNRLLLRSFGAARPAALDAFWFQEWRYGGWRCTAIGAWLLGLGFAGIHVTRRHR